MANYNEATAISIVFPVNNFKSDPDFYSKCLAWEAQYLEYMEQYVEDHPEFDIAYSSEVSDKTGFRADNKKWFQSRRQKWFQSRRQQMVSEQTTTNGFRANDENVFQKTKSCSREQTTTICFRADDKNVFQIRADDKTISWQINYFSLYFSNRDPLKTN